MDEDATPAPIDSPSPDAPRAPRVSPRALELLVVGVVLATGVGLSVHAFATEPSDAEVKPTAVTGEGPPAPIGSTSLPSLSVPSPLPPPSLGGGPGAILIDGSSNIVPKGCAADLTFTWKVAPGNRDLLGKDATIQVDGPDGPQVYLAPVTKRGITLKVKAGLRGGGGTWVARIFGIEGGTFPEEFPLEVSYSGTC